MPAKKRSRGRVPPSSVGRVGTLTLEYLRQGQRTVFGRTNCQTPWHLLPPIYLDETGTAYTLLLNPSGGLVGGDYLSIGMKLDKDTHVLISTPSANRVYRSQSEISVQEADIRLGPGAILEWVPEPTIPFAGSRYRQAIRVQLAPGATVMLWDAIASGRIARGERWAFASLANEIRITTASGQSVLERYHLNPTDRGGVGLATDWDYVASLYLVSDAVSSEVWKRLEEQLAGILEERPGSVLGGLSQPAAPGLAVKLVARSAPDLNAMLEAMWGAIRTQLWGHSAPALRRY